MKKAIVWFFLAAAPLRAQVTRPGFGIATGLALPAGQFHSALRGEGFRKGLEATAFASFKVRVLPVELRLEGSYWRNGANDALKSDLLVAFGVGTEERVKLLGVNLELRRLLLSRPRFTPYAIGGIGMYHSTVSIDAGTAKGSTKGTAFGWNLGGGFLYAPRRVGLFMEARFLSVGPAAGLSRITLVPVTLGLQFGRR